MAEQEKPCPDRAGPVVPFGCFTGDGFHRFDEVLYRNPNGYWFLVRPLAPDEAQEWAKHPDHDDFLAERRLFPDAD